MRPKDYKPILIEPAIFIVLCTMAAYQTRARRKNNQNGAEREMRSRYVIGPLLGSGGFGVVHMGTRIRDQRPVAIKTIPKKTSPIWVDSVNGELLQEVALLRAVQNVPNVLKLLETYESETDVFLVLERPTNSQDLYDYITDHPHMSEDEGRAFFCQIMDIVGGVLSCGVFHGDIKDENFVVDLDSMQLKLIDFGLGFYADCAGEECKTFHGTKDFAPPEWTNDHRYLALPAAVWTLGVLLFTLLNGQEPLWITRGDSREELQHVRTSSKKAQDLVARCMARDPDDRIAFDAISNHPWLRTAATTN